MMPSRNSFLGNIPPATKNLLLINVAVFVMSFILNRMGIDLSHTLGLHSINSTYFKPYQFVTHMFMHDNNGFSHIFFNMFALYMFGRMLETVWGPKRFLIYYFVTGLGAAALHSLVSYISLQSMLSELTALSNTPTPELFLSYVREYVANSPAWLNDLISSYSDNPNNNAIVNEVLIRAQEIYVAHLNIPTVGASGAVFGVLLAFGMLFPNTELMLLFPPIPIKAKWFVLGYGAIELFAVIIPRSGDNVAHFAHLGGMIFGYILIKYWSNRGIGNYQQF